MTIALLAPYGGLSQESGVMYLLANYLKESHTKVSQLQCNGVFSLCDRDGLQNWRRTLTSCLECSHEQRALADWGGLEPIRLSEYISPEIVQETKRTVLSKSPEQIWKSHWKGISLEKVLRGSFARRFGVAHPDFRNKSHQYAVQRLGLSAMRMIMASKQFLKKADLTCSFVASGDDFISASYCAVAQKVDALVVRFKWDLGSRVVRIYCGDDPRYQTCEILLDSISSVRSEVSSWPEELIVLLDGIVRELGLADSQLDLPIAQ
ncbi:MAG: hypothetical protein KDD55_09835 [Bdellovibrionales bacterium]|nr:hypothetical protein [Bdellovibrionales bacterium]